MGKGTRSGTAGMADVGPASHTTRARLQGAAQTFFFNARCCRAPWRVGSTTLHTQRQDAGLPCSATPILRHRHPGGVDIPRQPPAPKPAPHLNSSLWGCEQNCSGFRFQVAREESQQHKSLECLVRDLGLRHAERLAAGRRGRTHCLSCHSEHGWSGQPNWETCVPMSKRSCAFRLARGLQPSRPTLPPPNALAYWLAAACRRLDFVVYGGEARGERYALMPPWCRPSDAMAAP